MSSTQRIVLTLLLGGLAACGKAVSSPAPEFVSDAQTILAHFSSPGQGYYWASDFLPFTTAKQLNPREGFQTHLYAWPYELAELHLEAGVFEKRPPEGSCLQPRRLPAASEAFVFDNGAQAWQSETESLIPDLAFPVIDLEKCFGMGGCPSPDGQLCLRECAPVAAPREPALPRAPEAPRSCPQENCPEPLQAPPTCPEGSIAFLGESVCQGWGGTCQGDWPEILPPNPVFVLEGASGGNGSQNQPFASLATALAAARPSQTIVLGPGNYLLPTVSPANLRLQGRCPRSTILEIDTQRGATISGLNNHLSQLSLEGQGKGLVVASLGSLTLEDVYLEGFEKSIYLQQGAQLEGQRVVFGPSFIALDGQARSVSRLRDTIFRRLSQGSIELISEARLELERTFVQHQETALVRSQEGAFIDSSKEADIKVRYLVADRITGGLLSALEGTRAEFSDVVIGEVVLIPDLGTSLVWSASSTISISRLESLRHRETGINTVQSFVELSDIYLMGQEASDRVNGFHCYQGRLKGQRLRAEGLGGHGIRVDDTKHLSVSDFFVRTSRRGVSINDSRGSLERAWIQGSSYRALWLGSGSQMVVSDVIIRGAKDLGVEITGGAEIPPTTFELSRIHIHQVAGQAFSFRGGTLSLEDLQVTQSGNGLAFFPSPALVHEKHTLKRMRFQFVGQAIELTAEQSVGSLTLDFQDIEIDDCSTGLLMPRCRADLYTVTSGVRLRGCERPFRYK